MGRWRIAHSESWGTSVREGRARRTRLGCWRDTGTCPGATWTQVHCHLSPLTRDSTGSPLRFRVLCSGDLYTIVESLEESRSI